MRWWLASVILLAACNPAKQVEEDRRRFARLSATRPVGSACANDDSAAIQRARVHPFYPTGGWYGQNEVDPNATPRGATRGLVRHAGGLAGYLDIVEPGQLKVRAYDDIYGSVYCGWSPQATDLTPAGKPVRVTLGTCAMGDGGLDMVHEVCWFARGASKGQIIYSSAAPNPPRYNPVDLYRPSDLTVQQPGYDVIDAALELGDARLAAAVIEASLAMVARERDLVAGDTGKPIAAKEYYRGIRVRLLSYRLGLSVGTSDFAARASELQQLVEADSPYRCQTCAEVRARLPRYRESNDQRRAPEFTDDFSRAARLRLARD